jgi:hypothetical protein
LKYLNNTTKNLVDSGSFKHSLRATFCRHLTFELVFRSILIDMMVVYYLMNISLT